MAIATANIDVTADPVLLSVGAATDFSPGRAIAVYRAAPGEVRLGGSAADIGASGGFTLPSGSTFTADLRGGDLLYGTFDGGSQGVAVIQVGV